MAAIVTLAPVLIDATDFSQHFVSQPGRLTMGPYPLGADLLLVLIGQGITPPLTGMLPINVFRSSDRAATWAQKDAANTPYDYPGFPLAFYRAGAISVLYAPPLGGGGSTTLRQIITHNGTVWGPPTATIDLGFTEPSPSFGGVFYQQSTGQYVNIYQNGVGSNNVQILSNLAGAWTGPALFFNTAAGSAPPAVAVAVDNTDAAHLFYSQNPQNTLYYRRVSPALVAGGQVSIGGWYNGDPTVGSNGTSAIIWNSQVAVAYRNGRTADPQTISVSIGTPLSGPAFTPYVVRSLPAPFGTNFGYLSDPTLAIGIDGKLNAFWVESDGLGTVQQIWQSTFDGVATWGAPTLFYDEILNPPANSVAQASQQISHIEATQLTNGQWIIPASMLITVPAGQVNAQFALIGPAGAAPLINPGPGGRKPAPPVPNQFDFCLHREYRLYCSLDIAMITCGSIPACFSVDERDWAAG